MLISTNILRDDASVVNYIATANAQNVFNQVTAAIGTRTSCFNLIGSYGTGKSSFLVALEATLTGKTQYFNNESAVSSDVEFVKIIGEADISLRDLIAKALKSKPDIESIVAKLKSKASKNKAVYLVVDEFGKCLEYALSNNPKSETYFFQQLAESINDDNDIVLITTQHQNLDAYAANVSTTDIIEWEKVSGRYTAINFNEPPETLLRLASKSLADLKSTESITTTLDQIIKETNIIPASFLAITNDEGISTTPLDSLTSYIVISLLQKYGQNERSLFSFLNAEGKQSLRSHNKNKAYLLDNVYDFVIDRMSHVVYGNSNSDKLQWEAAERAIQRADHHGSIDPKLSHPIIKAILLINVFGRDGVFDIKVAKEYFRTAFGEKATTTIDELVNKSIVQYLRYKNKLVFVEGTDINIENELLEANRKIPVDLDLSIEFQRLIQINPILGKKHFQTTGTPRFAEVHTSSQSFDDKQGVQDGNAHILVATTKRTNTNKADFTCVLGDLESLSEFVRSVLKYEVILEKYSEDLTAKRIIKREHEYAMDRLQSAYREILFKKSLWRQGTRKIAVTSDRQFNSILSDYFNNKYSKAPEIVNELINKSILSASINTARRNLLRLLVNRHSSPSLGYVANKYPADKTILYSTLVKEKMYDITTGRISAPKKSSTYFPAWKTGLDFLNESRNGKRSLKELIDLYKADPFGMKDGLLRIWLMYFLVAEEENYALYYSPENKFLPYFSDDIYESILKKPDHFVIKRYNYDRLPEAMIAEYKNTSNYINKASSTSARAAYFRIYGELLSKLKNLDEFTKKTKSRLSKEAIGFRDALVNASDPEEALISGIPSALGFNNISGFSPEDTAAYFKKLRDVETELGSCFASLLGEFYSRIAEALGFDSGADIKELKQSFVERTAGVDPNQLHRESRVLFQRIKSPLDIKDAWTRSVVDAIIGKNLEKVTDNELTEAFDNVTIQIDSLLEACQIHSSQRGQNQFVLKITLPNGRMMKRVLNNSSKRGNKVKLNSKEFESLANKLLSSMIDE